VTESSETQLVVRVTDNQAQSRYEAFVGDALVGFVDYQAGRGRVAFTHTEVEPALRGRGVGSALARRALDDARDNGRRVRPICPFITKFVKRHAEYDDVVT
jgi:predicted GNAT family acetyltransferase